MTFLPVDETCLHVFEAGSDEIIRDVCWHTRASLATGYPVRPIWRDPGGRVSSTATQAALRSI